MTRKEQIDQAVLGMMQAEKLEALASEAKRAVETLLHYCLLYTSPSPRDS